MDDCIRMSRLTWRSIIEDPLRHDPTKVTPYLLNPPLGAIGHYGGVPVEFDDEMQFGRVSIALRRVIVIDRETGQPKLQITGMTES